MVNQKSIIVEKTDRVGMATEILESYLQNSNKMILTHNKHVFYINYTFTAFKILALLYELMSYISR